MLCSILFYSVVLFIKFSTFSHEIINDSFRKGSMEKSDKSFQEFWWNCLGSSQPKAQSVSNKSYALYNQRVYFMELYIKENIIFELYWCSPAQPKKPYAAEKDLMQMQQSNLELTAPYITLVKRLLWSISSYGSFMYS